MIVNDGVYLWHESNSTWPLAFPPQFGALRNGVTFRKNLEHIHENLSAATWLSSVDLPVKLAVIPEGALQGFTDEVLDMEHTEYREEIAIDISGKETEKLGEYAKEFDIYIVASAKEKAPEYEKKFVNTAFVIDPDGDVILKHQKTPLFSRSNAQ
jgi:formamidase